DLAGHPARHGSHGAARADLGAARDLIGGGDRGLLGRSAVLVLRLHVHDAELSRLRDARVPVGAAPADRLHGPLPALARSSLLHVGTDQSATGNNVALQPA